jgi:aspartate/methionine/tyrosine aminotransferase
VADDLKVPIISDEVYYDLVYGDDAEFHSFGNLGTNVPVIVRLKSLIDPIVLQCNL